MFIEFFKIGLFAIGGGLVTVPFLFDLSEKYGWFSKSELADMIAISESTPGPIGINMATFAGFKTLGVFGALTSSVALILPMIIIASLVFRLYKKFSESKVVKEILYVLRPTSCALIASVGVRLFYELVLKNGFSIEKIDYLGLIVVLFFLMVLKCS